MPDSGTFADYGRMLPLDEHNQRLLANVHPGDWRNPTPANRYDLVIIGAGTAGLVTAAGAAGLGAKVALVERHLLGGDCLNVGCVPSKALIAAARAAAALRQAHQFGISVPEGVSVDFPRVMERMRRLRANISPHDSAARFRGLGVDLFLGSAQFTSNGAAIEVGNDQLLFRKAVICTGARAATPDIPGLSDFGFLTNENLFSLTQLPRRLAVIGGGPIGCEMAQAFSRFGSKVTLFEASARLLQRDDEQAAHVVMDVFRREGIDVRLQSKVQDVRRCHSGAQVTAMENDAPFQCEVDAVLVGLGRHPNIEGLQLKSAGVACDEHGVNVNDFLQTTNPRIYAAGDVCSTMKFTHAADFQARIIIQNSLFRGRARASRLLIPWCTYTSPEVAHVGLSPSQAEDNGRPVQTFVQELNSVDRAVLDGEEQGFVKVHVQRGTDRILGATVVAAHAGELISELTLAMHHGIGLKAIAATIHPYPTQAEAIRKLGDQFNRTRLTPFTARLLRALIRWLP